jgi:putative ABC transport system substrate-binding protein
MDYNRDAIAAEFAQRGHVSGRNLVLTIHFIRGDGQPSQEAVKNLYAEVLATKPDLILPMDDYTTAAAKDIAEIPIVFGMVSTDAEALELVGRLSRPQRNVTGFTRPEGELVVKRLELLHAMAPKALRIGVLSQGNRSTHAVYLDKLRSAAATLKLDLREFSTPGGTTVEANSNTLMTRMLRERVDAFLLLDGYIFTPRLVDLAARNRLPAIYPYALQVTKYGGLASYSTDKGESGVVDYASRILDGVAPADLPVQQQREFSFVINLEAARRLGLTISPSTRMMATRLIEK